MDDYSITDFLEPLRKSAFWSKILGEKLEHLQGFLLHGCCRFNLPL